MQGQTVQAMISGSEHGGRVMATGAGNLSDTKAQVLSGFEALQIGGVAPHILRELSGIYPTFVSAFKELVSNAYDADATLVTIQFSPDLSTVTVEDNGIGMTPFEFQNEYIRIGGGTRRWGGNLTAGGRWPIGRKGIGFLAVARYCYLVEVHSHANRVARFRESVTLEPWSGLPESRPVLFLRGQFAQSLKPFTIVQAVRCGTVELATAEYSQDGLTIKLPAEAWRKFGGQVLTVEYTIDFRAVDLQATIDYDYLLSLEDGHNLEMLQDFCHIRLAPSAGATVPSFTCITLHLHEFVRHELQAPQRRGRVRNVGSASGLDRFIWHLSRSIPVPYDLSLQELERLGLEVLAVPVSPTPFSVKITSPGGETHELRRPLLNDFHIAQPDDTTTVRQTLYIESGGLAAQGALLGFPQPIFPAEMRGIAIRVRGVEIGAPGFLGMGNDLPAKYRPFLDQVMGEVIVTEGLDAISAIMPGREAFYAEDAQFQVLRKCLVGDGSVESGALGKVLEQLGKQRSVESSVERIVQEARRRRETFLEVSQAVTALSVGSRHSRALQRLFSRSDVVANGLCRASEYHVELPNTIEGYTLELVNLPEVDYQIDLPDRVVRINRDAEAWSQSLYMLGRDFEISLRNGGPDAPLCEIDFSTNTIYLNWLHSTRGKMGDATFVKSALFWRIAYLAADGNVDTMMDLAHRLLSFSA